MTYLILQTALIMLAAYIAGALIGCMARRMIYGGAGPNLGAETSTSLVDGDLDRPMIETNDGSAAREREKLEAERFARVLTQAPEATVQSGTAPASTQVSERAVEQRSVRLQPAQPEPGPTAAVHDDGEAYRQVSTAAAAAAATAAIAAATGAATSDRGQAVAAGPAQDLTLIRGIDASTSDTLAGLGITRYEQIASWRTEDVRNAGAIVGSEARPARENWIEQAKILASGGQTAFSRSRSGVEEFNLWQWVAATGATVMPTYPPAKSEAPQPVEDRGIDAASPRARQSVYGSRADSSRSSQADDREASGGFAATAAIATVAATAAAGATGVAAALASENDSDEDTTIVVVPPVRETEPATDAVAPAGPGDDLTRIKGVDEGMQDQLVAQGITAFLQLANWKADDITRFEDGAVGVNHGRVGRENWIEQAQILASGGETEYSRGKTKGYELAQAAEPIARDERTVKADAAVEPTPSQDQDGAELDGAAATAAATAAAAAATLAASTTAQPAEDSVSEETGAEPAVRPARLADAIKARQGGGSESQKTGLAGLRSVRSQALRGDVGAAGSFDDLKRIRGIGVLIEKKLNSLGITSFEQIANWSNSEIDRLSQVLDFKGRIERENWVEQARILASGGHTEFSRRLDQDRS